MPAARNRSATQGKAAWGNLTTRGSPSQTLAQQFFDGAGEDIARVDAEYERLDVEAEDKQYLKRDRLDELEARKIRLKTVRWPLFPSSHLDHRLGSFA